MKYAWAEIHLDQVSFLNSLSRLMNIKCNAIRLNKCSAKTAIKSVTACYLTYALTSQMGLNPRTNKCTHVLWQLFYLYNTVYTQTNPVEKRSDKQIRAKSVARTIVRVLFLSIYISLVFSVSLVSTFCKEWKISLLLSLSLREWKRKQERLITTSYSCCVCHKATRQILFLMVIWF